MANSRVRLMEQRLALMAAVGLGMALIFLAQGGYYPELAAGLTLAGLVILIGLWSVGAYRVVVRGRSGDLRARRRAESQLATGLFCILGVGAQKLLFSTSWSISTLGLALMAVGVLASLWGFWTAIASDGRT